ncbi:MAG: prolyl oligopeptidase family serine peptidase [Gammaproteobacteria bacterium]|nr:prolyl oligopeptidase family serine peptidase [Gammaproteobacteria bacterium]
MAEERVLNNGNLVVQDVPEIPREIVRDLFRYQSVRAAGFRAWTEDGSGIYVSTSFGDVDSIHRVDMPMGARRQQTFYEEPVGSVLRQPGARHLMYTRDAGGSEFAQVFMFDPETNEEVMLSDGESRNGAAVWDRRGTRFAYQSTRRNGASNDIWIMDPDSPDATRVVLESPDGSWWGPAEFSESGSRILATNYVSVVDSRVHVVDLDTGASTLLAGGVDNKSVNYPVAFDDANDGFWLITNQGSDFNQLAWQANEPGSAPKIITGEIPWNVTSAVVSDDRKRMAFVTNEDGMSRVYLLDPATQQYTRVDSVPVGRASGLKFSPGSRQLGMSLNTTQTPRDAFVLELGDAPLEHGELIRWTHSEVGGLDTSAFRIPELVHYPTFDQRNIPAWVYRPSGEGPHPVVISIHGGPEGQARPSFSSTYQMWLDKLGVAVIQPNVRGSNGYGTTYLGLDNGFKREDSVRDIGALLDWIKTQPDLDASRVAVFGGSYGGYMVLASAVHYSDRLRAAVDIVGISNFVTFLENTQDYRRDLRRAEYGDERDPAMRAHLEEISPLNNVDKIDVPMFIVQGENDPRVPVTEAIQMVEALRSQGQTVWYMNALNEGHGYRKKENRDVYQQATILFLQQHLVDD